MADRVYVSSMSGLTLYIEEGTGATHHEVLERAISRGDVKDVGQYIVAAPVNDALSARVLTVVEKPATLGVEHTKRGLSGSGHDRAWKRTLAD